jgi:glycosyltransferase involved in cell wall biosynthesis
MDSSGSIAPMNRHPLSICFIAPYAFPLLSGDQNIRLVGGSELQQVFVARQLAARGHQVSMICLNFGQADDLYLDGIRVIRSFRPGDGLPALRFIWPRLTSIWNCLKRANAAVYYHRTAGMMTGVMAKYCEIYGKKSVFASAGNPDLVRETPRIKYARDRWIYEYGLRHVDRILVQNDEQARLCRANFGREATRVLNCYPAPVSRRPSGGGEYVLWVSTIRSLKQPELFLDLAAALPDIQFRMIGGPGIDEAALYRKIQARADAIPNVQFLGFVPYTQIDAHFDAALLFVNTSESEGFPNTFLQAWSRGIPTVSFVDAGARLDGSIVGELVETLAEMQTKVAALSSDMEARVREGARCKDYFERNHLPERIVDQYEAVFRGLRDQDATEVVEET